MNYYNEFDPFAAEWLQNLIDAGELPPGHVDTRSITEVSSSDLEGYTQHHFFAGIGGWSLALKLAGWPTTRAVWTGSCPCQAFSSAGKQKGFEDARDLWPVFWGLYREHARVNGHVPIFGEQVASAIRFGWLDRVQADMEAEDITLGACVLGAHSIEAPHIRRRLFWVGNASQQGSQGQRGSVNDHDSPGRQGAERHCSTSGFWTRSTAIQCRDGKSRRVPCAESGIQPLAHGIPRNVAAVLSGVPGVDKAAIRDARRNRVGQLKGYGNAIVPQVAAEFVRAFMEVRYQT